MKKNKEEKTDKKPNKIILRIKRLFSNIKTTEWAGLKSILGNTGGVVLFTTFFVLLFTLVDFIASAIRIAIFNIGG